MEGAETEDCWAVELPDHVLLQIFRYLKAEVMKCVCLDSSVVY